MRIVLKNGKISLGTLLQILLIGHAVGTLALLIPIMIISWLFALVNEEIAVPDVLFASIILPLALVAQTLVLALVYRVGFWVYEIFKPVEIEITRSN